MIKQFYSTEKWFELNYALQAELQLSPHQQNLFLFHDTHAALLETFWSFSRQFMIKKKLFYVKGVSPYFNSALNYLMGLGYDIVELDLDVALNDQSWMDNIDHTVLGFLYAKDIPFLGRYFNWEDVQKKLADKRVFQIEVIHNNHYIYGIKESGNPYHLQLYDFLGVATLGVLGQRVTLEPIMTAGMNWEAFTPPMILHQVQSISENKDLVLQAEQQLSQVDWTLGDKILRYYDRMVFAWQDLDASAFIESLNKQNLKVVQNAMQTTSLVYWGGLRCMEWLQSYAGLNSQLIRGLVVIDKDLLASENFVSTLLKVRQQVMKLQKG